MQYRRRLALMLAICPVSTTTFAQSLTLYSGTNFSGQSKVVSLGSTNVGGFVARSADANGRWRVCSGPLGLLGCRTIEGRVADLGGSGMTVVSAVFGLGTGGNQNPGQTGNQGQAYPPQTGVTLYSGPNYTGQQKNITSDMNNLNNAGFNDMAQSAMVAANESWQLCEHSNYDGNCINIAGSMASLVPLAGSGSSLRRVSGAQGYPQPSPYPGNSYPVQTGGYATATGRTASFFAQPMFNGRPMRACPEKSAPNAGCAKKSAEQFCQLSGFSKLAYSAYSSQGFLEDVVCVK